MTNALKVVCPFCHSENITFFTGKRAMPEGRYRRTAGFSCEGCGNVSFWSFPLDVYERKGIYAIRRQVIKNMKGALTNS